MLHHAHLFFRYSDEPAATLGRKTPPSQKKIMVHDFDRMGDIINITQQMLVTTLEENQESNPSLQQ